MDDERSLLDEIPSPGDAAAEAFARLETTIAAMDGRLALMVRAVEHIARERQDFEVPDYSETLGEIRGLVDGLHKAARDSARSPLWQLTPETIAAQIDSAAAVLRRHDAETIKAARKGLETLTADLGSLMVSRRSADDQRRHVWRAALSTAVITMLAVSILPGMVARRLPDSWQLPETIARQAMDEPTFWEAGAHLMRVDDPAAWQEITRAVTMRKENFDRLIKCEKAAAKSGRYVECRVQVRSGH